MRCDALEPLIEAIADGSHPLSAGDAGHMASCAVCAARLEEARAIERLLASRPVEMPSPSFVTDVMMRVGAEQWKAERAIDIGFNLALAAGVLVIVAGTIGLAWSLGFLTVSIDLEAIWQALGGMEVTGRFLSQMQTVATAAALLTMALVLWWWAETATD